MSIQLDILTLIEEAKANRDAGIAKALENADQAAPYNWSDKAYNYAKEYILNKHVGARFQVEDIRMQAEQERKVMPPPSARAWGGIIVKIRNEKLIMAIGTEPVINPKAHRANATVWVKINNN